MFLAGDVMNGIVQLGDFGSSKQLGVFSNNTFHPGTILYFSPERFEGELSTKVDIWALAVSMYPMLTNGELYPFTLDYNDVNAYLHKLQTSPPNPLPDSVSEEFRTLLYEMLTKDATMRPDSVSILRRPFIWRRVQMITDEEILGQHIATVIKL